MPRSVWLSALAADDVSLFFNDEDDDDDDESCYFVYKYAFSPPPSLLHQLFLLLRGSIYYLCGKYAGEGKEERKKDVYSAVPLLLFF